MELHELPEVTRLVSLWLQRPKHSQVRHGSAAFARLIAAAVRWVRHGALPNRLQRCAYRSHKARRANKALRALYGDPGGPLNRKPR